MGVLQGLIFRFGSVYKQAESDVASGYELWSLSAYA